MSRIDAAQRLMPSIVDRLIDPESGGTAWGQGYSLQQMIEVVRRDLEELLNTRQSSQGIPKLYAAVHDSIVGYGLPDMAHVNASTAGDRGDIGRIIETIVARHEPRLRDVRASLSQGSGTNDKAVVFQIEARLNVDPSPEVGFETVLELMTGHTTIKQREL